MKFKRLIVLLQVVCCCLLPAFNVLAAEGPGSAKIIRVGVYDNFPKVYRTETGRILGLFPELLEHIAATEGWTLDYVYGNWVESLEKLERGEIDIMVDVAYSEERAQRFAFNQESIMVNWGSVYTQKNQRVESFLDLSQKRIAVMQGSHHTEGENGIKNLLLRFNVPATIIEVESYQAVFNLLDTNQADAGVVNRIFGAMFAEEYDLQQSPILFNPSQLRFAFPKHALRNNELIRVIDRTIREEKSRTDSTFHRLSHHYLSGQSGKAPTLVEDSGKGWVINLTQEEKAWIKAHPVIRFGLDPEFVPFEYLAEDGEYHGIASDYLNLLNQRLGLTFEIVRGLTWEETTEKARNREIDLLPCVGKTLERLNYLRFSKPYLKFQRVIITRSDFPFITGLNELRNIKVAVQSRSSHQGFLSENTEIQIISYETLQRALLSVSGGETDAFVGNIASATYWIRHLNLTNLKVAAPVAPETINLYMAVRSDWPELVGIINKGLQSISREEENRIYQKWIAIEYQPATNPELVWKYIVRTGIVAAAILMVILLWNLYLKREITRRKQAEERLQFSNRLEHMVSEHSSRFISLKTDEIDAYIEQALGEVARLLGASDAGVFEFKEGKNQIHCTHRWSAAPGADKRTGLVAAETHDLSWWIQCLEEQGVYKLTGLEDLPEQTASLKKLTENQGIRSVLDVSRKYQNELVGFLRLGTEKRPNVWTDDAIAFVKLIGQIITNALQRKRSEQMLQDYTRELQTANTRLKELDQLKSMFIASMSHELRTPLNSIIGFTGIILKGMSGEINAQQKDQLQRVFGSAKHLLNLITDVIDISKIEAGRIEVMPEEFMLAQLVEEAVNNVSTQLHAKGLILEKQITGDLKLVQDRRRLLQCIINYLSNAVKYTERGKITLVVRPVNQNLEILVQDTGIGIRQQDMSKVFQPFERLDSHLRIKAGGAGLGLYLTRKIIRELLNGETWVKSRPGEGSIFGLKVPINLNLAQPQPA